MTMLFRTVKTSIETALNNEAGTYNYQVIGYQRQSKSADEINALKFCQIFYSNSTFQKTGSSLSGPVLSDVTYRIELSVAQPSNTDLATLNDSGSSTTDKATALANSVEASKNADDLLDEFFDNVYQVLQSSLNYDFDLDKGTITNSFISRMDKNTPIEKGEFLVLTGALDIMITMTEQVDGDVGVDGDKTFDTTVFNDGDDTGIAGSTVDQSQ